MSFFKFCSSELKELIETNIVIIQKQDQHFVLWLCSRATNTHRVRNQNLKYPKFDYDIGRIPTNAYKVEFKSRNQRALTVVYTKRG